MQPNFVYLSHTSENFEIFHSVIKRFKKNVAHNPKVYTDSITEHEGSSIKLT